MAKRVFEIAKELGISAKTIIDTCGDKGIPKSSIRNQMSIVPAKLEVQIREWMGGGGNPDGQKTQDS